MDNVKFRCSKCLTDKQSEKLRTIKQCTGLSKDPRFFIKDNNSTISFNKCVGNFFDHSVPDLVQMHGLYEQGVMPFSGAPADQPCKIMDAFDVIATYKSDKLKQESDKAKARSRARGR